jgi:hypothetical protein
MLENMQDVRRQGISANGVRYIWQRDMPIIRTSLGQWYGFAGTFDDTAKPDLETVYYRTFVGSDVYVMAFVYWKNKREAAEAMIQAIMPTVRLAPAPGEGAAAPGGS